MEMQIVDRHGEDMWEQLWRQASDDKRAAIKRAKEAERMALEIEADYNRLKRRMWLAVALAAALANVAFWVVLLG